MELLQQYWLIGVIAIGLAVGYVVYLFKTKGEELAILELRHDILNLILLAEKKFADKDGKVKFDWVADRIYNVIPIQVKFLFTSAQLEDLIQLVYQEAKDLLDEEDEIKK